MNEPRSGKPRPWFRFSLRTLLLLVGVAGVGFGYLGYKMRQAERQREAVQAIWNLGGYVLYDYQVDSTGGPDFNAQPPGPEWMRKYLGVDFFAHVNRAHFVGWSVTDGDLVHLRKLPQLKFLGILSTQVTDAGLAHLRGLSQLKGLRLSSTEITGPGMIHLQGLPRLQDLDLEETEITAEACQELQKVLPSLKIHR